MSYTDKKTRLAFWTVVLGGSGALGALISSLGLTTSHGTGLVMLLVWMACAVALGVGLDVGHVRAVNRKIEALQPLLDSDPDGYVAGLEALLSREKNKMWRQVLTINSAVACHRKHDFAQAEELLRSLDPKRIKGRNAAVYWADLALTYIRLDRPEEAVAILRQREHLLKPYRDDGQLGPILASMEVCRLVMAGDAAGAREVLLEARSRWPESENQETYDALEKLLR